MSLEITKYNPEALLNILRSKDSGSVIEGINMLSDLDPRGKEVRNIVVKTVKGILDAYIKRNGTDLIKEHETIRSLKKLIEIDVQLGGYEEEDNEEEDDRTKRFDIHVHQKAPRMMMAYLHLCNSSEPGDP